MNMEQGNEFYNFAQDLMIDLNNAPSKFIDLKSLIDQLTEVFIEHGNCKCAIVTDRNLKFNYLYRINKDGNLKVDCLYPHKGKTILCANYHVFVPEDKLELNEKREAMMYRTNIHAFGDNYKYIDIKCIGDNGKYYDCIIENDKICILITSVMDRDVNMKITVTFVVDNALSIEGKDTIVNE